MKTIYKHKLNIIDTQVVAIEGYETTLKVAEYDGFLQMWYVVDKTNKTTYGVEVTIIGTGHPIPDTILGNNLQTYFDSVIMSKGFVWHVFIKS